MLRFVRMALAQYARHSIGLVSRTTQPAEFGRRLISRVRSSQQDGVDESPSPKKEALVRHGEARMQRDEVEEGTDSLRAKYHLLPSPDTGNWNPLGGKRVLMQWLMESLVPSAKHKNLSMECISGHFRWRCGQMGEEECERNSRHGYITRPKLSLGSWEALVAERGPRAPPWASLACSFQAIVVAEAIEGYEVFASTQAASWGGRMGDGRL